MKNKILIYTVTDLVMPLASNDLWKMGINCWATVNEKMSLGPTYYYKEKKFPGERF